MRRSLSIIVFLLLANVGPGTGSAMAEHFLMYAAIAPGAALSSGEVASTSYFGVGGQRIYRVSPGTLSAGAEIGYLFPLKSFKDSFGLISTNGYYHFIGGNKLVKLAPFITAGHSLAFSSKLVNLVNYGGGVDYWFRDEMGLRMEVRDHIRPGKGDPIDHFLVFRIGLMIRGFS